MGVVKVLIKAPWWEKSCLTIVNQEPEVAEGRQIAGLPRESIRILTLPQNKDFRLPCAAKMLNVGVVSTAMHLRQAVGLISQLLPQRTEDKASAMLMRCVIRLNS